MRPIVVGTDGSEDATLAVRRAAEIAKGTGARVHLVTAMHETGLHEPIASSARTERVDLGLVAESVLARAGRVLEDEGVEFELHTGEGEPARVISEVAEEVGADLIVVGARGKSGMKRFRLGGVSSKLTHHAPTSVMVVRPPGDD